jgi:hypothetical protein
MSLSRRSRVLIPGDQELSLVQLLLHILQPPLDRVPDDPVQHGPVDLTIRLSVIAYLPPRRLCRVTGLGRSK